MLTSDRGMFSACSERLTRVYGPIDIVSEIFTWGNTDYYREEMGAGLLRQFVFFRELRDPAILPSVKHFTATMENVYSAQVGDRSNRRINLDPGYVTEAKIVLASTKDFAHRVYLGGGIYGEVTLRYCSERRQFVELDHTFPDFRSDAYRKLFLQARDVLRADMRPVGRS